MPQNFKEFLADRQEQLIRVCESAWSSEHILNTFFIDHPAIISKTIEEKLHISSPHAPYAVIFSLENEDDLVSCRIKMKEDGVVSSGYFYLDQDFFDMLLKENRIVELGEIINKKFKLYEPALRLPFKFHKKFKEERNGTANL